MPTGRQNDVILASICRQIDFSMLHLYISFKLWPFRKKKACQYLYFKISLDISQNDDMSAK